jgi:ribonuclease-3
MWVKLNVLNRPGPMQSFKGSNGRTEHLEAVIGLRFRDPHLLREAMVHSSFVNEQVDASLNSYERMEYLGDAVLGMIIAAELFISCPHMPEGDLTKARVCLVRSETLAEVARRLDLGNHLVLGNGAEITGGRQEDSILVAAFEALIGAVFLDQDFAGARRFVLRVMKPELEEIFTKGSPQENSKSWLQEYLQGHGRPFPRYRDVSGEGPSHALVFTVQVLVDDKVLGTGKGRKKVDAEQAAAEDAIRQLWTALDKGSVQ